MSLALVMLRGKMAVATCCAVLFSLALVLGTRGLSRIKLEDVPQVVLQSPAMLLYPLTTLHRASNGARMS